MKKNIWGRVGIMFRLTEEEFAALRAAEDKAMDLIRAKLTEGDFQPDGETYFGPEGNQPEGHWRLTDEIALDL